MDNKKLWDMCVNLANEKHDGHFTVMKFTTNWRACFGTPMDRDDIQRMVSGKTLCKTLLLLLLDGCEEVEELPF